MTKRFRRNGENMDILNEAKKNFDYMVRIRRHMHEYPENSGVEYETVKYIASELDALGIEYVVVPEGGIIGQIHGGKPGKTVLLVAGDGGFKMTGSELFTLASYHIPVIVIVFNNSGLGMIRQLQQTGYNERYMACNLPSYVDFVKYAAAFGLAGEHVSTPDALASAVEKAMKMDQPYVIETAIPPKDMVVPMVAAGKGIDVFVPGLGEKDIDVRD